MKNLPSLFQDPFRELSRMQRQMDQLFDQSWTPSTDIEETESHYVMSFDLPGVKKEDIKVELNENMLTVSGERKDEHEEKSKGRFLKETFHGAFTRSFALPAGVSPEQIESSYKDGVLRLSVPKAQAAKARRIKVA